MNKPKKTEAEQIQFYNQCHQRFLNALARTAEVKHYFEVGDTRVCLLFAGESMVPYITPALEHLRIPETETPDVTFCIWDSDSTSVEMVPPPCDWSCFTDRGDIWGFDSNRIKTAFHWGEFSVNVMDIEANTGIYWVQSAKKIPFWVLSSPLRSLFHWWMEKNNMQLIHAAVVGTKDGAILLTGNASIGKSTTAITCLQYNLYYLSDDYVIVRKEPELLVYSLYCAAKVNTNDVENFPFFSQFLKTYRNFNLEKAVMFLYPEFKELIVRKMPLKAILMLRIIDQDDSNIATAPYWTIREAMSFTTMSQLPNAGRYTYDFICKLCNRLPAYVLELGKDLSKIPVTISEFLSNPRESEHSGQPVLHEYPDSNLKPLISVIVPVYNGEEFIKEAIDNILSQKYPALEIIIVNDGSTDNSEAIIKSLPTDLRYFYQDNNGPSSARNRGIRDASGEFISFLDVDDLWPENNLNLLVSEMLHEPDLQVIHGFAQVLEKNETTGIYDFTGNPKESFPGYIGAGLYRKSVFNEVGLFDTSMNFGEDADWFKRASELKINIRKLEEVTLYVRRHEKNMTRGKSLVELNALRVFKKSLDRSRNQNPGKDKK